MYIRFKFNLVGCAFSTAKRDWCSHGYSKIKFLALITPNLVRRFHVLVYLAQIVGHFADGFAWQQGAERSLLYHFVLSRGPRVVFQRISINIMVLLQKLLETFGSVLEEWYWQGKNEVLWEKPIAVPICPPQIRYGVAWNRIVSVGKR